MIATEEGLDWILAGTASTPSRIPYAMRLGARVYFARVECPQRLQERPFRGKEWGAFFFGWCEARSTEHARGPWSHCATCGDWWSRHTRDGVTRVDFHADSATGATCKGSGLPVEGLPSTTERPDAPRWLTSEKLLALADGPATGATVRELAAAFPPRKPNPYQVLRDENARLRSALAGLVGADGEEEPAESAALWAAARAALKGGADD
jgi:hypothetical protein